MNKCPKCGSNVNPGEAFCRNCGTKLSDIQPTPLNSVPTQQPVQEVSVQPVQNVSSNEVSQVEVDDDLCDAYIGKNVDGFKKKDFSFHTFFLGVPYILYRKMYFLGILYFVGNMIAVMFLPSMSKSLLLFANIYISAEFKKWYLKNVQEQVNKIKLVNKDKSREELIAICARKGGTTWVPVIILLFIYLIIIFLYLLALSAGMDVEE